jgi:hypothetical protein
VDQRPKTTRAISWDLRKLPQFSRRVKICEVEHAEGAQNAVSAVAQIVRGR